jgi:hypothetical protein
MRIFTKLELIFMSYLIKFNLNKAVCILICFHLLFATVWTAFHDVALGGQMGAQGRVTDVQPPATVPCYL